MAERSKALDWNSSNILTGVRGFESHSLRQIKTSQRPQLGSNSAAHDLACSYGRAVHPLQLLAKL